MPLAQEASELSQTTLRIAGNVEQVVKKIEKKLEEIEDDNVLQFCSLDKQAREPQPFATRRCQRS